MYHVILFVLVASDQTRHKGWYVGFVSWWLIFKYGLSTYFSCSFVDQIMSYSL